MNPIKVCGSCNVDIKDENSTISCGKCSTSFHTKCAKISLASLKEITKNKSIFWLCATCNDEPFSATPSSCCSEEKIVNAIRDLFSQKILDVDIKCDKIDQKLDTFIANTECSMKYTDGSINVVNDEVQQLKRIIDADRNTIDNMSFSLLNLQRGARLNNLLLDALPEHMETENLLDVIIKIGTFLKCPIEPANIESCFRLKTSKGKLPSVLVKFTSKTVRDGFFGGYLKHGNLKLSDILSGLKIHSRLYLNEHLTPYDQYLMNAGTKLRYKKVINACFSRNGNVYFRKEVNGKMNLLNKNILAELETEDRSVLDATK